EYINVDPAAAVKACWRVANVRCRPSRVLAAEQVALAPAGQDQRPGEAPVDLLPQEADVDVDHVGRDAVLLAVELLADQRPARHQPPRASRARSTGAVGISTMTSRSSRQTSALAWAAAPACVSTAPAPQSIS